MSKGVKSNSEVKSSSFLKEVGGMALVLFSVLSFLCLITGDALFYTLGASVQGFLLGLFGVYAFFVLFDLALLGLKLASGRSVVAKRFTKKYFVIRVTIICVFAILHLAISHKPDLDFGGRIAAAYTGGLSGFSGTTVAGVLGTLLTTPIISLASYFGTYFLYGVTVLLCIAYVFGKNFFAVFKKGGKPAPKSKRQPKKPVAKKASGYEEDEEDEEDDGEDDASYEPYFFDEDGAFLKKSKKEMQSGAINDITPFTGEFLFKDGKSSPQEPPARENASSGRSARDEVGRFSYVEADGYGDYEGKIDLKKQKDSVGGIGRDFSDYGYDDKTIGSFGKRSDVSDYIPREDGFSEIPDDAASDDKVYTVPFEKPDAVRSKTYSEDNVDEYDDTPGDDYGDRGYYNENNDDDFNAGKEDRGARSYFDQERDSMTDENEDIFGQDEFSDFNDVRIKTAEVKTFEREEEEDDEYDDYPPQRIQHIRTESARIPQEPSNRFFSGIGNEGRKMEYEIPADDGSEPIENMPIDYKYNAPPIDLLEEYKQDPQKAWEETNRQRWCIDTIIKVIKTKKNIDVQVENVTIGPAVSRYDISVPEPHGPTEILALRQDLAFRLQTGDELRMYSVPYTSYIGIEIKNKHARTVGLRESLLSENYANTATKKGLHFVFGEDLLGNTIVMDLNSMPHLLVCGTTGSGKSVCLNVMLISLMYRYSPAELRLIIVDPKMVEFQNFKGAPHLVFNEILGIDDRTISVLEWCVEEMERRYRIMANSGCKDVFEYNKKTKDKKMPCLLILIDEYADLVNAQQQNKKKIENCVDRLAAKARAAGISLVLAMQRASAAVVSGSIKTNIISRICFQTGSGVDSRVILDEQGAEKLLGSGDALYRLKGAGNLQRGQGAYLSNDEAKKVLDYIIENNKCYYDNKLLQEINDSVRQEEEGEVIGSSRSAIRGIPTRPDEVDEDYKLALRFAIKRQVVSGSSLRTQLRIGYNKSASIINWMEKMGYISPILENRMRKVLFTREDYEETYGEFIEDDF